MKLPERPAVAEEQLRYARVLEWGARIGLAAAVLAFALYVAGVLPGRVPLEAPGPQRCPRSEGAVHAGCQLESAEADGRVCPRGILPLEFGHLGGPPILEAERPLDPIRLFDVELDP